MIKKEETPRIRLCILDLDGTVLDTVGTIAHHANRALAQNGFDPIPVGEYNLLAGGGIASLIRGVLRYRAIDPSLYDRILRDYETSYRADVVCGTRIFDGLREELDRLKAAGIRLAIVSNKPDAQARGVISLLYGEGYFDSVTGQVPGGVLKPDPREVLAVMERMGASPAECVYVGDTSTDMETGQNAGLYTVGVLWGFRGREELVSSGADAIVETPRELAELILTLPARIRREAEEILRAHRAAFRELAR